MRDAEANFPQLAPIRIDRDHRRDVWRVMTRRGAFEVRDDVPRNRRDLVEFFVYQLTQLNRRAEREDRDNRDNRRTAPMYLRVGDVITVNGREARIVGINPHEVTVDQLDQGRFVADPREIAGRCNCYDCRRARERNEQRAWNDMAMGAQPFTPEAERRSMELLRRNLTPAQLQQWDREQAIDVRGQSGTEYRIRGQITAYNIDRIGVGQARIGGGRLCCTPGYPGELPLGDYVLGQKLALEHDEERFLREANHAGVDGPDQPAVRAEPGQILVTNRDLERLFRDTYAAEIPTF